MYYEIKPIQAELLLYACLTGFGGIFDNQCHALPIPHGPATQKAYITMFTDSMSFLVVAKLLPSQVYMHCLLSYMEYLHFTPPNISNCLPGIRAHFIMYNLPTSPFRDEKIKMFITYIKINRPLLVKILLYSLRVCRNSKSNLKIGGSSCL